MIFDRAVVLDIGLVGGGTVRVTDLRVTFDISKKRGAATNSTKIEVYNLSKQNRDKIKQQGAYIHLQGGYNQGASVEDIFSGDAQYVLHRHEPPEVVTEIECQDGVKSLRESILSCSFGPGASGQQVFKKISDALGFPLSHPSNANITGTFPNGFAYHGPARAALDKVTKRFGLEWSVQYGALQIMPFDGNNGDGPIPLSAGTGLIGSPQRLFYTAGQLDGQLKAHTKLPSSNKEGAPAEIVATGYKVKSLLIPKTIPGGRIQLDTLEVKGTYRIEAVHHTGDTRGQDWYTEIEVVER